MCENDRSGIYSLGGFAYQIKVFVLEILQLQRGYSLEYETIDDVALNIEVDELDEYEDQLCNVFEMNKKIAFQVKKTNVTNDGAKKIVKNWILTENKNKNIDKYVLVTDRKINKDIFTSLDVKEIFSEVNMATGSRTLDAKVKLLNLSEKEFVKKTNDIISKACIKTSTDIDNEIMKRYERFFVRFGVTEFTYVSRIKQLMSQISMNILEKVVIGEHYILTYEDMCRIQNQILTDITDEEYKPSFEMFRKLNKINLNDLSKIKPREVQQLKECKSLNDNDIVRHLQFSDYYVNSKNSYFELGKRNIVDDLERTAFDNFCDVKMELRIKDDDTPDNRLIQTKAKSNLKAVDDQIRYGVCIHLTSEETDKSIQISWKDDVNE